MNATKKVVRKSIKPGQSVGIFIGPEGDSNRKRLEQAMEAGAQVIPWAKRILRTETAGLTVLSILMFHLEAEEHILMIRREGNNCYWKKQEVRRMKEVYLDNSATTQAYPA